MKKIQSRCILIFLAAIFLFLAIPVFTSAAEKVDEAEDEVTADDIYEQLLEQSRANELLDELPEDTKSNLSMLNIDSPQWSKLNELSFMQIITLVLKVVGEESVGVLGAIGKIIALMLLCALIDSFKTTLGERPLSGIISAVSTICICAVLVVPIINTIESTAKIISIVSGFMLAYVPVMAGIIISSGQPITGASYYTMMMGAGQVVNQVSTNFLVPMLNVFLGLSISSGISTKINMKGLCDAVYKVIKWVLGFVVSIFTTILTLQNVLSGSADGTTIKAAKFALSNFVPVVGGALGDAFQTVQGCVKLLKSGVGVFAVIACAALFLPSLLECVLWNIAITLAAAVGDIFNLSQPAALLRSCGKVISTMTAIVLSCMTVFIISTTIIIAIGGS